MNNNLYMPFHPGDYLADTAHLSAAEHGAYLLLIMNYWQRGAALPNDDRKLRGIARMSADEWSAARESVLEFFQEEDGQLYHRRIEAELERARDKSDKAKASAERSHSVRKANAQRSHSVRKTDAEPLHSERFANQDQDHSTPTISNEIVGAAVAAHPPAAAELPLQPPISEEADLFRRGKAVLGPQAGGVIKKLIAAKGGSIRLARAAIETAADKGDAMSYLGGILRARDQESEKEQARIRGDAW